MILELTCLVFVLCATKVSQESKHGFLIMFLDGSTLNVISICSKNTCYNLKQQMGNGSVNELCYTIDGFDVKIDPFGDVGCMNIQDKVIIGLLGGAVLFSLPFLHLTLGLLTPIFWCLGKLAPQINSRESVIEQTQENRRVSKDAKIEALKQLTSNTPVETTVQEPKGDEMTSQQAELDLDIANLECDLELDFPSREILRKVFSDEKSAGDTRRVTIEGPQNSERKPSKFGDLMDAIFVGT